MLSYNSCCFNIEIQMKETNPHYKTLYEQTRWKEQYRCQHWSHMHTIYNLMNHRTPTPTPSKGMYRSETGQGLRQSRWDELDPFSTLEDPEELLRRTALGPVLCSHLLSLEHIFPSPRLYHRPLLFRCLVDESYLVLHLLQILGLLLLQFFLITQAPVTLSSSEFRPYLKRLNNILG